MPQPSRVSRIVHRQAAAAVSRLLEADALKRGGVSIKALTLSPSVLCKKATHALTCETLRLWGPHARVWGSVLRVIKELVAATPLSGGKQKVPPGLLYVLAYDLLFGQGLEADGDAERQVLAHKSALKAALARVMIKRQVADVQDLVAHDRRASPPPRYVRVNTLKLTVEAAKRQLATSLPGVQVVDACAAPGNKTTHLAALMGLGGAGRITACELDPGRLKRLQANVVLAGAKNVQPIHADFLAIDPTSPHYKNVRAVLLDPSCSGSGTTAQRMDHLMPSAREGNKEEDARRIQQLARFQIAALRHALSFPSVERVVYSTCSVNREENEDVVAAVWESAAQKGMSLERVFRGWPHRGLPVVEQAHCLLRTDAARDKMDGFFVALFSKPQQGKPTTSNKRKKGATLEEAEQVLRKEFVEGGVSVGNERSEAHYKGGPSARRKVEDMVNKGGVCTGDQTCVDQKVSQTNDGKLRRRRLKRQRKKDMASNTSEVQ